MKKLVLILSLVSLVAGGAFLMGQGRAATATSQPSRVAVLRLADVLTKYNKLNANRMRIAADQELYKVEVKKRQEITDELSKQLKELQPGTDDYRRLDEQLWKETFEAKAYIDVMQGKLERARLEGLAESYQDVVAEVKALAEENGIDLVQITGDVPLNLARNLQELEQIMNGKRIIYSSDAIDITDAIVKRLNDKVPAPAATPTPQN